MMQHVADGFTVAAVLAGLWAAWLWWAASRVPFDPNLNRPDPVLDQVSGVSQVLARYVLAMAEGAFSAANLNQRAAKWTAASVALQAIATVLGRLAMP